MVDSTFKRDIDNQLDRIGDRCDRIIDANDLITQPGTHREGSRKDHLARQTYYEPCHYRAKRKRDRRQPPIPCYAKIIIVKISVLSYNIK